MVDDNSQDYDDKMKKYYSKLDKQDSKIDNILEMIKIMMDNNQNLNHSPDNMDSPKYQGPTTEVPANNKALTLKGGHSTKKIYVWTLKHDISSPKLYKLLINT